MTTKLSTSLVTIQTPGQPAIISLDSPKHLACMACGQQVGPPHQRVEVEDFSAYFHHTSVGVRKLPGGHRVALTRCSECLVIRDRAEKLLDAHPRLRASIGSRSIGVYRVEIALSALNIVGNIPFPSLLTERAMRILIAHMSAPGGSVWWSQRFSPVLEALADACTSTRWAHVTEEQVKAIRDALSEMLRARIERPRPYGPPLGTFRGCLFCGIEAVSALPSRADGVWTQAKVRPHLVGGRHDPSFIDGYLCPSCAHAVEDVGSPGITAMERSLVNHLGVRQRTLTPTQLAGLKAWAVVSPEVASAQPWDHISNLAEIRDEMEA